MIEAGVVIDWNGNPIHWHLPPGRSGGSLPDDRGLWDVLWHNRGITLGFAHSHPGAGVPGPSWTDITTFAAVEVALGRRLSWWITSSDLMTVFRWQGPGKHEYQGVIVAPEPHWVERLRELSK